MGFIGQKADGIIVKKKSPKTHYWKLYNGKQHEDARLGSGLGIGANLPGGFSALVLPRSVEISVSQNLLLWPQKPR